jgi:membrane dipeptidase
MNPTNRMKRTLVAALALLLPALAGMLNAADLSARADALHARIFTIDTHIDTPTLSLARNGWDISRRHDPLEDWSQCDIPRMREGGLDAAVFAIYVEQKERTAAGYEAVRDKAFGVIERVLATIEQRPEDCALALDSADGLRLAASGRRAIFLSIENGYAIGRSLDLLDTYHAKGVRIFGFVHRGNNDLADSSQDPAGPEWKGLSPLGRAAVQKCNELGIVIDASHAKTPVILSHTACKALLDHPRNVGDDILRELAANGGVIQMNTVSRFLVDTPDNPELNAEVVKLWVRNSAKGIPADDVEAYIEEQKLKRRMTTVRATFDDFLAHLLHAIEVAGIDHVGIGADMDGGGGVVGMEDVSGYPRITRALLERGYSDADIAKIWGGNTLRVLRAAEEHAAAHRSEPAEDSTFG